MEQSKVAAPAHAKDRVEACKVKHAGATDRMRTLVVVRALLHATLCVMLSERDNRRTQASRWSVRARPSPLLCPRVVKSSVVYTGNVSGSGGESGAVAANTYRRDRCRSDRTPACAVSLAALGPNAGARPRPVETHASQILGWEPRF